MTRRALSRIVFVAVLSLAFPASMWAQTPTTFPSRTVTPPVLSTHSQINAPEVSLGQPGLSFRYSQTFGVTAQAYQADVQHLNGPDALYVDSSGNVYIGEDRGCRILKFNSAGTNLSAMGIPGLCEGQDYAFNGPAAMAKDASGNLWVADGHHIVQYSPSGQFLQNFPAVEPWNSGSANGRFNSASGIAFDSVGRLYVGDQNNHRVQVFSFSGGTPVYSTTIGESTVCGNGSNQFCGPSRLTLDSLGRLYVADTWNSRIQRCTFSGGVWGCATFDNSGLLWPYGVARDISDTIYIADSGNGRIRKCPAAGSCSDLITGLTWAPGVAVSPDGNTLYVSEKDMHVVHKYTSNGISLGLFAGVSSVPYIVDTMRLFSPYGITVASDGSIYAVESWGYRLVKLDSSGTQQWAFGEAGVFGTDNAHLGGGDGGPEGTPVIDGGGRILVPDSKNNRIQAYNSNGGFLTNYGLPTYQFSCPAGMAISPVNGDIYIADRCNQRVQVYDKFWTYKTTLGVTGVSGTDVTHFKDPRGVAVDASGNVYVLDSGNNRVQKCTVSGNTHACVTFAGVVNECGNDFAHLCDPRAITVDTAGRVYVADTNNQRVQVFDATGAYLTSIGGGWGANSSQAVYPSGVAVDKAGNIYVADRHLHRIQKFAPGVPGWIQRNINGFGVHDNQVVSSLEVFGGQLYAGTGNWTDGGRVWRSSDGANWTPSSAAGFGSSANTLVFDMIVFQNHLYASTYSASGTAEIWRTDSGVTWTRVVSNGFGDSSSNAVTLFGVFSDTLYAAVEHTNSGIEIWRSSSGGGESWTRVAVNGFGNSNNIQVAGMMVFNGYLYVNVLNTVQGDEVWRSNNGIDWYKANASGFGDAHNTEAGGMAIFNGFLYAGVQNNTTGGQLWRTDDGLTWHQVIGDGLGDPNNDKIESLYPYHGALYIIIRNSNTTGLNIWRTPDGQTWQPLNTDGLGSSNNISILWSNNVTEFNDHYFTGTWNWANGGQIWQYLDRAVFLPLVMH